MRKQVAALVVAGSFALMTGCALFPGIAGTGNTTGNVNVGFAGQGYSVQAVTQAAPSALTFNQVMFQPTKIELHYAGDVAATDPIPADIKGESSDQSAANAATDSDTDTAATANDGKWITLPVENPAAVDLTALGSQTVSFGEDPLKAGKYDQIRLTGGGTYAAVDANSAAASGSYTLPSGRLYINQGFEVRAGYKTDLKFSFDPKAAMVTAGTKIILKPSSVKVFATYTQEPAASPSATPAS
ncbi:MAG TPA: DUF4382 domain-containing protein [Stenomitos sp.]